LIVTKHYNLGLICGLASLPALGLWFITCRLTATGISSGPTTRISTHEMF